MKTFYAILAAGAILLILVIWRKNNTTPSKVKRAAVAGGSNNYTAVTSWLGQFGMKARSLQTAKQKNAFANLQQVSAAYGGPVLNNGVSKGNVTTATSGNGPAFQVFGTL